MNGGEFIEKVSEDDVVMKEIPGSKNKINSE